MEALTAALAASGPTPDVGEHTQQLLAAIVESSDDAIVSKNLEGVIQSWNAGAERLFGYSADEVIGKSITILLPSPKLDEELRILSRIRRGEPVDHYETIRRRKDGSLVDISLTVSPVRDASGRVVGASKIARDISERKRAEQALAKRAEEQAALYAFTDKLHRARSTEEVYEAALDTIRRAFDCERASILIFAESGRMEFVSWRGLSEGYRRAVEGHSPWDANVKDPEPIRIDDVDVADLPPTLRATVKAEGIGALAFIPIVMDRRLVGKFMMYRSAPHVFGSDEVSLALNIARQLGFSLERMRIERARRGAEEALRESEQRLNLALNSGRMGAWEWDIHSGGVNWSPSLELIHGLQPGTFGGTFEEFKRDIHPDDIALVTGKIAEAISARQDYAVTYRMVRPDGTVRWLEAFGKVVLDGEGEPQKLAGMCMDITERQQAEAERDLLVAELSHRVKNTLATVVSIAQQSFPKDGAMDTVRQSFNDRIRALAQTHGRLAEASWMGVSLQTILLDELAPYRRQDKANVRFSGPPVTLNPKVALIVGLAIHELATNAAKYGSLSTKRGTVDVRWQTRPADRILKVSWTEAGGPMVTSPKTSGFGRMLLERAIAFDLNGEVKLEFAPAGLECEILVPLESDTLTTI